MWTTPWGHGYMGDYHSDTRLVAAMAFGGMRAAFAMIGGNVVVEEAARRRLGVDDLSLDGE